jgi:hypothetical protein
MIGLFFSAKEKKAYPSKCSQEVKEMRRSKGSWFISLAMVERHYERA